MDLVEADATRVFPVLVADEEVAHVGPRAVHDLDYPRRVEQDVSVGQVGRLVARAVGISAASDQPRPAGGEFHLEDLVVPVVLVLPPREEQALGVVRDGRVADDPAGIGLDERLGGGERTVLLRLAREVQAEEPPELVAGPVRVLGVGEEVAAAGAANVLVPREDDPSGLRQERREAAPPAGPARADVQLQPSPVVGPGPCGGQLAELPLHRSARVPALGQDLLDQPALEARVAVGQEEVRDVPLAVPEAVNPLTHPARGVLHQPVRLVRKVAPEVGRHRRTVVQLGHRVRRDGGLAYRPHGLGPGGFPGVCGFDIRARRGTAAVGLRFRRRRLGRQPDVDELPARGLVTVDGDQVPARLQGLLRPIAHRVDLVVPDVSRGPRGERAVDVDLEVLVVADLERELPRVGAPGEDVLASHPDVRGEPLGLYASAGRSPPAEAGAAGLPARALLVPGPGPSPAGVRGRIAPRAFDSTRRSRAAHGVKAQQYRNSRKTGRLSHSDHPCGSGLCAALGGTPHGGHLALVTAHHCPAALTCPQRMIPGALSAGPTSDADASGPTGSAGGTWSTSNPSAVCLDRPGAWLRNSAA